METVLIISIGFIFLGIDSAILGWGYHEVRDSKYAVRIYRLKVGRRKMKWA